MIDYACIFTTGGMVLWYKTFVDTQMRLDFFNLFIKNVLLDEKTAIAASAGGRKNSYSLQDSVFRWRHCTLQGIKLVLVVVYKEILQLTLVDELLEMVEFDLEKNIWPAYDKEVLRPIAYDKRFTSMLNQWESRKQAQAELPAT